MRQPAASAFDIPRRTTSHQSRAWRRQDRTPLLGPEIAG